MCLGCMFSQAQISTGESTSQVVRVGNRAEKGDLGLYLGATTTMFKNIGSSTDFKALPLINLKYMCTDKVEARLGIEWWKDSNTTEYDGGKTSEKESSMLFYPGIAYHFAKSNILDVYVGGELPFGWGSKGGETEYEYEDVDGNVKTESEEASTSTFNIGLGAFIGIQAYVCNLPLAIGLEYGVSTMYATASDGVLTKDGMSVQEFAKDVDNKRWNIGHQARLTVTYFFKM